MALTTVRRALAVRPLRPMTLPRSSGCTRTSRTLPLRRRRARTWTSSGFSTMPRTKCSSASSSTLRLALGFGGVLGRRRLLCLRLVLLGLLRSGLLGPRRGRLALGLAHGLLDGGLEELGLVGLRLGDPQRALGTRLALELLPVAGDLEDRQDGLGRLGADAQPVLHPLGVDLDERGLLLRVVFADLLDGAAIALGAGVGYDDPVVRCPDLPQTLELNLDCHGCGVLQIRNG